MSVTTAPTTVPSTDLLATQDVTRLANRTEGTIRAWVRNGRLPAIRLPSGQHLYRRADVERLLADLRAAEAR